MSRRAGRGDDKAAPSHRRRVLRLGLLAAAVSLATFVAALPIRQAVPAPDAPPPRLAAVEAAVGSVAPPLTWGAPDGERALADLDGLPVRLATHHGSTLLVFWATWCESCVSDADALMRLERSIEGSSSTIVAVATREPSSTDLEHFVREHGIRYTVANDVSGDVGRRYRVNALPVAFVIDGFGVVRRIFEGPLDGLLGSSSAAIFGATSPTDEPRWP